MRPVIGALTGVYARLMRALSSAAWLVATLASLCARAAAASS